jgi:hypothetical protein
MVVVVVGRREGALALPGASTPVHDTTRQSDNPAASPWPISF